MKWGRAAVPTVCIPWSIFTSIALNAPVPWCCGAGNAEKAAEKLAGLPLLRRGGGLKIPQSSAFFFDDFFQHPGGVVSIFKGFKMF